jgi:hypothetical protein
MAGWSITIIRQAPEDYPLKLDRDAVLASWKVGAMGTNWIEALVERGEARCLQMGGYPNLYTALAAASRRRTAVGRGRADASPA